MSLVLMMVVKVIWLVSESQNGMEEKAVEWFLMEQRKGSPVILNWVGY